MVFPYYRKLNPTQKRIYRRSDEVQGITLPGSESLAGLVPPLQDALVREDRGAAESICQRLASGITAGLQVPSVRVKVLAARPNGSWGELHGLYEPAEGRRSAKVTIWMRTAKHRKVVAFRSFLRTLLHELGHHLDYELLKLPESFHTEGFYKRESSLFHQLVREE